MQGATSGAADSLARLFMYSRNGDLYEAHLLACAQGAQETSWELLLIGALLTEPNALVRSDRCCTLCDSPSPIHAVVPQHLSVVRLPSTCLAAHPRSLVGLA